MEENLRRPIPKSELNDRELSMSTSKNTHENDMLLSVVRELYGNIVWAHKTHEKERELCSKKVNRVRWINVLLIALATTLVVVETILHTETILFFAGIAGAFSTALVVYQLSYKHEKQETEHRRIAKRLLFLRDRYLVLIQKIMSDIAPIEQLQKEFENIQHEVSIVYEFAPDSSHKAYEEATKALKKDGEHTFSQEEIDMLLPEKFRLTATNTLNNEEDIKEKK